MAPKNLDFFGAISIPTREKPSKTARKQLHFTFSLPYLGIRVKNNLEKAKSFAYRVEISNGELAPPQ